MMILPPGPGPGPGPLPCCHLAVVVLPGRRESGPCPHSGPSASRHIQEDTWSEKVNLKVITEERIYLTIPVCNWSHWRSKLH